MKEQYKAEMEAKRKEKKRKKQVTVKDKDGKATTKEVSEQELARLRLEAAVPRMLKSTRTSALSGCPEGGKTLCVVSS